MKYERVHVVEQMSSHFKQILHIKSAYVKYIIHCIILLIKNIEPWKLI